MTRAGDQADDQAAVVAGPAARQAAVLVITGPSGVGKGTVVAALRRRRPDLWLSVSATTRPPRSGEIDGEHYYFLPHERFTELLDAGQLLESARFAGRWYGTPAQPLRERVALGQSVVLEIELEGARQIRQAMPEAILVFLAPPSMDELRARLTGRGTEDDDGVASRLARAEHEIEAADEFDCVIVNNDVDRVVASLLDLIPEPSQP